MSLEVVLLGIVAAVVAALVAGLLRSASLRRQLHRPLPGVPLALKEQWLSSYSGRRAAKAEQDAEETELSLVDVLFHLSRLDRAPLRHWDPRQIPGDFASLLDQFAGNESSEADAQFSAQHVGEQLLAEQLRQQGHDVELVEPSEHEPSDAGGWRARVDGWDVHIMASLEVAPLRDFLERVSEVPILTLADYAEEFACQARVLPLQQVTRAHVMSMVPKRARDAQLARVGDGDVDEAAFAQPEPGDSQEPAEFVVLGELGSMVAQHAVSPLMLTALRSAQLAAQGDSDWMSTATYGLADGAASSVGGWAGARAGALAGALLGPMGVAAGGFLGGILGKKVAEGLATGYKEKQLRRLLAEQDAILAQIPQAVREGLASQATHLDSVARELATFDSGLRLWPRVGSCARRGVALEYRRWQREVKRRSKGLQRWLKEKPKLAKRAAQGRQLLQGGALGWSPKLLELRSQLTCLAPKIEAEQRKLGQDPGLG